MNKPILRVGRKVLVKTGHTDPAKPMVGLAELSEAMAAAGERSRKERAAVDKLRARMVKSCPCHGRVCREAEDGGKVCQIGVCVRMN